jgi:hypothetical protein
MQTMLIGYEPSIWKIRLWDNTHSAQLFWNVTISSKSSIPPSLGDEPCPCTYALITILSISRFLTRLQKLLVQSAFPCVIKSQHGSSKGSIRQIHSVISKTPPPHRSTPPIPLNPISNYHYITIISLSKAAHIKNTFLLHRILQSQGQTQWSIVKALQ